MKNHSSLVVWALAAAVLGGSVACGEVSSNKADASMGDTAPAGDFTIGVNPGTLSVGITGEGTVAIDLIRGEGLTDAVALSVSGAPTGVSTELDVASLPLGTNAANLTVTAGDTAEAGTATLTVTATAGAITHTATLDLTLTTLTVTGSIRPQAMGVVVRIVGKSATTTNASGGFTFTDVKVPYDIYVIGAEGSSLAPPGIPTVRYYKGLTRADPILTNSTLITPVGIVLTSSSANVDGTLTGANAGTGTMVFWGNTANGTAGAITNLAAGVSAYADVDALWRPQAANSSGKLYALQITRGANNRPTGYPTYGVSATTNLASAGNSVINLTMAAPTTAALTGAITQPAGYTAPTLTLTHQFGVRDEVLWTATVNDGTARIPVIADGKSSFHGTAAAGPAVSEFIYPGLASDTDISFTMPAAPVVTGPVDNAMNITTTTAFDFSTATNLAYRVDFISSSARYRVFTTSSSVTIPNVSEVPLPANTAFDWTVTGFGPAANVNASADTVELRPVASAEYTGSFHFQVSIPDRTFTTQP